MGRPLNNRVFGSNSLTGLSLQFTNCWIPGEAGAVPNCYIVKQTGTSSFVAKNPVSGNSGVVTLVQTVALAGQASLAVAPLGAGVGGEVGATLSVKHVTVTAGGTGYAVGDTITLPAAAGNVAAVLTVATVTSGAVATISITTAGSYKAPLVGASATTTNHSGTGATITVTGYGVATLYLIQGGVDYTAPVTVAITGGAGTLATGTASVVAGSIASPAVVVAGDNYTSVPTVTVTSSVGLQTARKITMAEVMTFEGNRFFWHQDATVPDATFAALPLI